MTGRRRTPTGGRHCPGLRLRPRRLPRLGLLAALLLAALARPAAAAGPSPEFFQLLNELKEDIGAQGIDAQGPVCVGAGLVLTRDVVAGGLGAFLFKVVVVEPLEDGAKTALGSLPQSVLAKGAWTAAVSTYDLIGCAMDSDGPRTYAACVGKVAGAVVEGELTGRVKEQLGLEDPATTQAFDRSYKAAKGAIHGYRSRNETWSYTTDDGDCRSQVSAVWNKHAPGRRGGTITLVARHDCDCPNRYGLDEGSYRVINVPVQYAPAEGGKPGWRLGPIPRTRAEAKCCGGGGGGRQISLDAGGRKIADRPPPEPAPTPPAGPQRPETGTPPAGGSGGGTSTREPPPPPPPVVLPAPPLVEYSRVNPCPPCQPIRDAIDAAAKEIGDLGRARNAKLREQNEQRARRDRIRKRIAGLEARLRGKGGTGGSSYDPATGLTTESVDMGDGRVRIRVLDSSGHVVPGSERFRPSESSAGIEADLAAARKELAGAAERIAAIGREIAEIEKKRADAVRRYDNLQSQLDDCVERMCPRYASCEQLRELIQSYFDAGLQSRSRGIINRLMREAREKGCFDEDRFDREVRSTYDLTGERPPPAESGLEVEVERVEHIRGNNPFDARDPLGEGGGTAAAPAGSSGGGTPATVQVINGIPVSRLLLRPPDTCPSDHYHGSADNCDGVFTVDPAPGACGQGPVSAVVSIPVPACPDL